MKEELVDIHLNVEKSGDSLLASILFLNNSNEEIYLDKQTICIDNKTRRNVFNIMDEKNNKVKYIGVFVNRDVLPDDYIKIEAGEKIEVNIILNTVYELNKDCNYRIQYSVFHPTYMDDAGFTKLESNTVEIVY